MTPARQPPARSRASACRPFSPGMLMSSTMTSAGPSASRASSSAASAAARDGVALHAEIVGDQRPEVGLVVDDEDARGAVIAASPRRCGGAARRRAPRGRAASRRSAARAAPSRPPGSAPSASPVISTMRPARAPASAGRSRRQRRAVHVRHAQVADHGVDAAAPRAPPAPAGRSRRWRPQPVGAQPLLEQGRDLRLVVDDQHPPAGGRRRRRAAGRTARLVRQRQVHAEARALAGRGVELDPPAVRGDDAVADREPDAGADALRLGGEEGLEGALGHVRRPCPGPLSATSSTASAPSAQARRRAAAARRGRSAPAGR